MYAFEIVAERKIQEAIERGEFDNNPLAGKPLPPDGLDNVSPELRMALKILKNAGVVPEEIELRKQIITLQELLRTCAIDEEKVSIQIKLNEKQLRYNMLVEKRTGKVFLPEYQAKILEKLKY
jgi:ribosome-associated protein YbcJ (S4-like RNA binding protein)